VWQLGKKFHTKKSFTDVVDAAHTPSLFEWCKHSKLILKIFLYYFFQFCGFESLVIF
jgi:hypothetical protein